jgi:hypothetical protein
MSDAFLSWRPEVIADNSGKWTPNAMRFATEAEAKLWVDDLSMRWMAVRETRVVQSTDPVNYRIVKGDVHFRLEAIA